MPGIWENLGKTAFIRRLNLAKMENLKTIVIWGFFRYWPLHMLILLKGSDHYAIAFPIKNFTSNRPLFLLGNSRRLPRTYGENILQNITNSGYSVPGKDSTNSGNSKPSARKEKLPKLYVFGHSAKQEKRKRRRQPFRAQAVYALEKPLIGVFLNEL
jgi:hypothetical protein